jgi:hypothetical protein
MRLWEIYQGSKDPFEGDRTLWLRSLPADAQVTRATVTLVPRGAPEFKEAFVFDGPAATSELDAGEWGVTKVPAEPGPFVEVDFHARRTLASVWGTGSEDPTLQVDVGGTWVGIAKDGTFYVPGEEKWVVKLNSKPSEEHPLPGIAASKFKLSAEQDDATLQLTKVAIRSCPANVSVRLGQMPPFWTRTGELATDQGEMSPDFSAVLNAFLVDETAKDGFYAIPLVLHSDSIARLDATLTIDYVVEQPVLPPHLAEVTIPYDFSTLPGIAKELLTVDLPRQVTRIVRTTGAVLGTFESSRVTYGEIGELGEAEKDPSLTISPDYTLAQPIQMEEEKPVTGIDLPLANTVPGSAGLHLALQEDGGGKPSGEVLASAEVQVTLPVPGGSAWGSATLPSEFRFEKEMRYWLVLQSLAGQAHWRVQAGQADGPALLASTDGGFSWRPAATEEGERPLSAHYRLRTVPERFTIPLHLQLGKKPDPVKRIDFDQYESLGRVEFDLDFAADLEAYLSSERKDLAEGTGELITNGSFEQPAHDDASRQLFGYDVARAMGDLYSLDLSQGVDLSRKRFISLSAGRDAAIRVDCASNSAYPAQASASQIMGAIRGEGRWTFEAVRWTEEKPEGEPPQSPIQFRIVDSTGAGRKRIRLHPWRQEGVPQGWQQPSEAEGAIHRAKWPATMQPVTPQALPKAWLDFAQEHERDWTTSADITPEIMRWIVDEHLKLLQIPGADDPTEHCTMWRAFAPAALEIALPHLSEAGCPGILEQLQAIVNASKGIQPEAIGLPDDWPQSDFPIAGTEPSTTDITPNLLARAIQDGAWPDLVMALEDVNRTAEVLLALKPETLAVLGPDQLEELDEGLAQTIANTVGVYHQWQEGQKRPERIVAVMTPTADSPAVLRQRVPVRGDRTYDLGSFFRTCWPVEPETSAARRLREELLPTCIEEDSSLAEGAWPYWEVRWLDGEGGLVSSERQFLDPDQSFPVDGYGMQWIEARLTAPPEAVEAEIEFAQPPSPKGWPHDPILVLDDVSFKPVVESIQNGRFVQWTVEASDESDEWVPVHWTKEGGAVTLAVEEEEFAGVGLRGDGLEDTTLAQVVEVAGGRRYVLHARAKAEFPLAGELQEIPAEQHARLVLRWLDGDKAVGEQVILLLDSRGFPTYAWSGNAPEGAREAEIQITQPRGEGSLSVESVSLALVDLVPVPLVFLAEAPGSLVVFNPTIIYEPPPLADPLELKVTLPAGRSRVARYQPKPKRPIIYRPPGFIIREFPVDVFPLDRLLPVTFGIRGAQFVERMVMAPTAVEHRSLPAGPALAAAPVPPPLASHPADMVAGVSERVLGHLAALPEPATTIGALAKLEPAAEIDLPHGTLLTLKAGAEMILALDLEIAPFARLANESLEDLVAMAPADLAVAANQPLARAERLQRGLRVLRLLLHNKAFGKLQLADLMGVDT